MSFFPNARTARFALGLIAGCGLAGASGCAYVGTVVRQSHYRAQLRRSPSLAIHKHLLDRSTVFVFGVVGADAPAGPMAVAALAETSGRIEMVDLHHEVQPGSYYGLNLPPGDYRIVAVGDRDGDGFYRAGEEVAGRRLAIPSAGAPSVIPEVHLDGSRNEAYALPSDAAIPVRVVPNRTESVFYPKGTLRTLDDPLFGPAMATLGVYQPAAFMEKAPLMFYALEEDRGHTVPVIFVHGIEGSPRDFADIVGRLDRRRYRPWFFYYPSGGSLEQLSRLFYEIFLSGATVPRQGVPVVIVAHSMGGLVVRDALNHYRGHPREQLLGEVVTISSPLGGHAAARHARRAPVVIPSWRDLDPEGKFLRELHRKPLPAGMTYHLLYTFGDEGLLKWGAPGDGVVSVSSQLSLPATAEATEVRGFNAEHTEVLRHAPAVAHVVSLVETVKTIFPEDHLRWLDAGGYELPAGIDFTPQEAWLVRTAGHYLDALASGKLDAFHPDLRAYVEACRGGAPSRHPAVNAWRKLQRGRKGEAPESIRPGR